MRTTILVLAAALAACSSSGAKVSVSTKMDLPTPGVAPTGKVTTTLAIGDHVTLDRARFLIRKVALEAEGSDTGEGSGSGNGTDETRTVPATSADNGTDGGGGTDGDAGGETVVKLGPLVIDLSGAQLDGGVTLLFDESVPAGTYDELRFQIHKLTPGETVSDPDFTPNGHSILLDLTVDGTPFTFSSDLTAVSEIEGPFKVADGGTINVTVTVDPTGWFTAADGSFLDPRVEANRSAIELNIEKSIRGFEDDDRDGEPDHG